MIQNSLRQLSFCQFSHGVWHHIHRPTLCSEVTIKFVSSITVISVKKSTSLHDEGCNSQNQLPNFSRYTVGCNDHLKKSYFVENSNELRSDFRWQIATRLQIDTTKWCFSADVMVLELIRLVSKLRKIRYLIRKAYYNNNDRYAIFDLSCKHEYKTKTLHKMPAEESKIRLKRSGYISEQRQCTVVTICR